MASLLKRQSCRLRDRRFRRHRDKRLCPRGHSQRQQGKDHQQDKSYPEHGATLPRFAAGSKPHRFTSTCDYSPATRMTSLPMCALLSISVWASAASSRLNSL